MCMYSPIKRNLKSLLLLVMVLSSSCLLFAFDPIQGASYDIYLLTGNEDIVLPYTSFGISATPPNLMDAEENGNQNITMRISDDTGIINTSYFWWKLRSGESLSFNVSLSMTPFEMDGDAYQINADAVMNEPISIYGCEAVLSDEKRDANVRNTHVNFMGIIPMNIVADNNSWEFSPAKKYYSTGKVTVQVN